MGKLVHDKYENRDKWFHNGTKRELGLKFVSKAFKNLTPTTGNKIVNNTP